MAATNHTTNYNLPQYVGTDKPTYLGDWNSTMSAIDTQMKTNADNASGALSAAQSAQTNANSALSTAQTADGKADTAISNAATAQSTADNASSVATSALSTANSASSAASAAQTTANSASASATLANSKADLITSQLNLNNITTYGTNDVTCDQGSLSACTLTLAVNDDGSLFKFYGSLTGTGVNYVSMSSSLRPETAYTINPAGIDSEGYERSITIDPDGTITLFLGFGNSRRAIYFPCVYWNSDFNDEPAPQN